MRYLAIVAISLTAVLISAASALSADQVRSTADLPLSEVHERQIIVEFDTSKASKSVSALCSESGVRHVQSMQLTDRRYEIVTVPVGEDYHAVLAGLSANPNVVSVGPNVVKRTSAEVVLNDPLLLGDAPDYASALDSPYPITNQWALVNTGCLEAWEATTGISSVVVAVLDTGVNLNHEDMQGRYWVNADEIADNGVDDDNNGYVDDVHGYDFRSNAGDPTDPSSDYLSHGNATSSIIAARGNNGIGISGVAGGDSAASGVRIMALRVGTNSDISVSAEINAIDYAIANGADIISMSFGGVSGGDPEEQAIDRAWDAGLYVVAASGNAGQGNSSGGVDLIDYPAGFVNCVAVGATTIFPTQSINGSTPIVAEQVANYSKTGEETEIVAPGTAILCCGHADTDYANLTYQFTGTSAATPIVAGVAALLWSADITANPSRADRHEYIRALINNTAVDLGDNGRDQYYGYGRIDALAAMQQIYVINDPGDTNGDDVVNADDIQAIIDLFGVTEDDAEYDIIVDANRDGVIDELDLFVIGQNYGQGEED